MYGFVNGCGLVIWKSKPYMKVGMFINCIMFVRLMSLVSIIPTYYIKQCLLLQVADLKISHRAGFLLVTKIREFMVCSEFYLVLMLTVKLYLT